MNEDFVMAFKRHALTFENTYIQMGGEKGDSKGGAHNRDWI
jgi:hypothetical protein